MQCGCPPFVCLNQDLPSKRIDLIGWFYSVNGVQLLIKRIVLAEKIFSTTFLLFENKLYSLFDKGILYGLLHELKR